MINTIIYREEIEDISKQRVSISDKSFKLKFLLERLCKDLTREEAMEFPNLFSRIVFIAQKFNLSKQLEWKLQNFRVLISLQKQGELSISPYMLDTAINDILYLCDCVDKFDSDIAKQDERREFNSEIYDTFQRFKQIDKAYISLHKENIKRVRIVSIEHKEFLIQCIDENDSSRRLNVRYNVPSINSEFNESVKHFKVGARLNLIDCLKESDGSLTPKKIVLEPDYLIDVSAIANCFINKETSHLNYFINKFEIVENKSYIMLGNLANFFLDELIFAENPENISFKEVFLASYKNSPFEYATCEDIKSPHDFRAFMMKAEAQFENIKRVIVEDFPKLNIDVRSSSLEPSFFSEKYGFQGRLDLLQEKDIHRNTPFNIIELKSGKVPFPPSNSGKIALSHEVQASIYRLLIESVYQEDPRNINAAILYSADDRRGYNLRFAARLQSLEKQILNLRNMIVHNESEIANGDISTVEKQFENLKKIISHRSPSFFVEKIERIYNYLNLCTKLERAYFFRFVQFITKELYIQKIGDTASNYASSLSSLWNSEFSERADALDLLYNLKLLSIEDVENGMLIRFKRTTDNNLVNFREGDICIVYPRDKESDNVLNKQILKGTIALINSEEVLVSFRYKQKNRSYFENHERWAVEHDFSDASYNSLYKNLFLFIQASQIKRDIILGITEPRTSFCPDKPYSDNTERILDKAMLAKDYFLIIGPPGTGKTSIFARQLIERYYSDETKNILVLAYTNRAVDELCEAVNKIFDCESGECDKFIRIGTSLSCNAVYQHRLLQNIASKSSSREELLNEINDTRIFISTLSSISSRQELFNLKRFDVAIIDEASQVLEPQIVGVLSKVEKFILIGDHNQLSTIVLQNKFSSTVNESSLNSIGLYSCETSFFERILNRCQSMEWEHAYSQLEYQGRMHNDIASFVSKYFYKDKLFPISEWQHNLLQLDDNNNCEIAEKIASNRMMFFSTEKIASTSTSDKINHAEAEAIISLVKVLQGVYERSNMPLCLSTIGIIAPYRNQIALIKQKLEEAKIVNHHLINVDSVERYQGSQRDIILISFCVNQPYQMDLLCNLSHNGEVDRKLNVAMTRARKHLFMVGNSKILRRHPIYATLVDFMEDKFLVL